MEQKRGFLDAPHDKGTARILLESRQGFSDLLTKDPHLVTKGRCASRKTPKARY